MLYLVVFGLLLLFSFLVYYFYRKFPGLPGKVTDCKSNICGYYEKDRCREPTNEITDEVFRERRGRTITGSDGKPIYCEKSIEHLGFPSAKEHTIYLKEKKASRLMFLAPTIISSAALIISFYAPLKEQFDMNEVKNFEMKIDRIETSVLDLRRSNDISFLYTEIMKANNITEGKIQLISDEIREIESLKMRLQDIEKMLKGKNTERN